jgi:hypothetical protein
MYELSGLGRDDVQVETAPPPKFRSDRRRPDRLGFVSPALISLLRNPAVAANVDDTIASTREVQFAPAGLSRFGAVFCVSLWKLLGLLVFTAAAIQLVMRHGSWIAFFGGIIL